MKDVSKILGYKPSALAYLLYKLPPEKKYKEFEIPKKVGGVRKISAPKEPLKLLQRRLAHVLYACRKEIEDKKDHGSLSHAFRKGHSIVTNARRHRRRRYVLNLDLEDFFPSLNFGRVRGYLIKNHDFALNDNVATILAQIACHNNCLPQGSPCSPILSDLISQSLDLRLARLAKQCRVTYSRYADDITFSTNQKKFPPKLAIHNEGADPEWLLGDELVRRINRAGFNVNLNKVHMQYWMSRQLVTGLTVNSKVNVRPEYYRLARAMCHSLFKNGFYYRPTGQDPIEGADSESESNPEPITELAPLDGMLSHIHYIKDAADQRKNKEKEKDPIAARRLYARFLFYRYFLRPERPLIICEGITDNVYLKCAIRRLPQADSKLGSWTGSSFTANVSFFNYDNQAHRLLGLHGGAGNLSVFLSTYKKTLKEFKHKPLNHPVIVMIDNDEGAKPIFKAIKQNYNLNISTDSPELFFRLTDNLYLVKTPSMEACTTSCIENFFGPEVLATKLDGKKFNPKKVHGADDEYGKKVFAEKVIRPNAGEIDFSKFEPLLNRIAAVIDDFGANHVDNSD